MARRRQTVPPSIAQAGELAACCSALGLHPRIRILIHSLGHGETEEGEEDEGLPEDDGVRAAIAAACSLPPGSSVALHFPPRPSIGPCGATLLASALASDASSRFVSLHVEFSDETASSSVASVASAAAGNPQSALRELSLVGDGGAGAAAVESLARLVASSGGALRSLRLRRVLAASGVDAAPLAAAAAARAAAGSPMDVRMA